MELARSIAAAMSDEDALAQLFMLGWRDEGGSPSPLILEWIQKRHIGGVKVFGWNTSDVKVLAKNIGTFQRLAGSDGGIPLLVATDQEGGFVYHVKDGLSRAPGAMAIGASGFPEDAYRSGYYIGRELAALGINMNFAPAVDLFINHDSTIIGTRSFGDDPIKTGLLGEAFARGQLAAGVIPTAKHFPGHGDTEKDSHVVLPMIKADFDTLWKRELVPYRMLSKSGIPAIMSGHIAFPNTKAGTEPASLSRFFLSEVLREKIGFRGLIVTDDLAMNGATAGTGRLSQTAKTALEAGNDVLMMSSTPSLDAPVWAVLAAAMKNDAAFRAKVRRSAERIIETKLRYLRGANLSRTASKQGVAGVKTELPVGESAAFFLDLASRSVTVLKSSQDALPLPAAKAGRVLLAYRTEDFRTIGRSVYGGAPGYWYDPNKLQPELLAMAQDADTIIFQLKETDGLNVLLALRRFGKRIIVVSSLTPAQLKSADGIHAYIAVYSDSRESLVAGFSVISGSISPQGELPFSF